MLVSLANRGYSGVGYDLSPVARQHARDRLGSSNSRFHVVEEWPSTERFQLVLLLEVIGYAPDPVAMLRDCRALLAPGGSLFVSFARTNSGYASDVVQGMRFFPAGDMRELLVAAGFARISLENYGFPLANALVPRAPGAPVSRARPSESRRDRLVSPFSVVQAAQRAEQSLDRAALHLRAAALLTHRAWQRILGLRVD